MKTFRLAAVLAAVLLAAPLPAQPGPKPPKLIVAIAVDQFSARLFDEYRGQFKHGLKRLAGGVVFANGYQAHGATETCPGHSTILTGDHPAHTGIISNEWIDQDIARADKHVYCAEDESVPGSNSRDYTVSDVHLRVPALGDWMKAAHPEDRVVSVAGKDRAAVMLGGHHPDQRWWWSKDRFVQNTDETPPPVADRVNAAIAKALATARPPLAVPPDCAARDKAIDIGGGKSVGTWRFERAAGDAEAFGYSPERDAATLAMAAALMEQMGLGRGPGTDLLAISLSATDYVGHRYGTEGVEMCLQLTSLDTDLGSFFKLLDRSGIDYAVVLTADHGGLDLPERQRLQGVADAARMSASITPGAVGKEVAARLGLAGPVFLGDWYLSDDIPADKRAAALALARQILAASPQVYGTWSRDEVAAHPMPTARPEDWSVLDRLRASYDPERSGDLFVVLKPNITPIVDPTRGFVATHGSVWDYDRKVPILFWWPGVNAEDRAESAMTVDILPTLAGLIDLPLPQGRIDGHCLELRPGLCR